MTIQEIIYVDIPKTNKKRKMAKCICSCGNIKTVRYEALVSGMTQSCGCLRDEIAKKINRKHGLYKKRIFTVWQGMKQRCLNKNKESYPRYGGRGITVCDEWIHSVDAFYNWAIANGYNDNLTIDRIDNDKGYYPENCQWVTSQENSIKAHRGKHHDLSHPKHERRERSDKGKKRSTPTPK